MIKVFLMILNIKVTASRDIRARYNTCIVKTQLTKNFEPLISNVFVIRSRIESSLKNPSLTHEIFTKVGILKRRIICFRHFKVCRAGLGFDLPSVLSSPFSLQHIGTRAQRILVSCRPSGTSSACIPGTCGACTCRSHSCCHTCTGTRRSW